MTEEVFGTDYPALRKHLFAYGKNNLSQDPRWINTNRMRQCWINYADFYRCTYVRDYLGKDTEVREFRLLLIWVMLHTVT